MLLAVRDYLVKRKEVSLDQLNHHFHTEPAAMRGMLAYWMRQGCVNQQSRLCASGACKGCQMACQEMYAWVG